MYKKKKRLWCVQSLNYISTGIILYGDTNPFFLWKIQNLQNRISNQVHFIRFHIMEAGVCKITYQVFKYSLGTCLDQYGAERLNFLQAHCIM